MKRWTTFLFAALVITFVAAMPAAAQQATDRPFKADLTGAANWEWPGTSLSDCTVVTTVTDATGQAAHLGRVATHWTHCPAEPDIVLDGWVTITAANGDRLVGRYNYDPTGPPLNAISWTGGTGRFANATGAVAVSFQIVQQFLPGCVPDPNPFPCFDFSVPWPWSATIVGTITY